MKTVSVEEHNDLVDDYNDLVDDHNDLVGIIKDKIDDYNQLADDYNLLVDRIAELEEDSKFFRALRSAGVGDWEGYSQALEIFGESE
jgi:cell fate (sporulation/competence/biofilm development) regulator YmcA (YheA/YmcA/DUF963 family)